MPTMHAMIIFTIDKDQVLSGCWTNRLGEVKLICHGWLSANYEPHIFYRTMWLIESPFIHWGLLSGYKTQLVMLSIYCVSSISYVGLSDSLIQLHSLLFQHTYIRQVIFTATNSTHIHWLPCIHSCIHVS